MGQREYERALRERRKAAGLCLWCGKSRDPQSACFCAFCLEKNRQAGGRLRNRRKAQGVCRDCQRVMDQAGRLCCSMCQMLRNAKSRACARAKREGTP
jgi:hypothetical protein